MLRRTFAGQDRGFYVDVGACDPVIDSVTLYFYERGWHGINVEPDHHLHETLARARPRDTNLCAAIGQKRGKATFYPTKTRGHGTLDTRLLDRASGAESKTVPIMMLSDIIDWYGPESEPIDFLKIDVEGWEAEVIGSGDWSRHRPRVVIVEAVDRRGHPTHETWEPTLLNYGYQFALFDGLNRFYCRDEDRELHSLLAIPANPIDNWVRANEAQLAESVGRLQAEIIASEQRASTIEAELAAARTAQREAAEEVEQLRREMLAALERGESLAAEVNLACARAATASQREEEFQAQLARLKLDLTRLEIERQAQQAVHLTEVEERARLLASLASLTAQKYEAEALLAGIRASISWRLTQPLRVLTEAVRRKLGRRA